MARNICLIPDAQVKPGVPLEHIIAAGQFIIDNKPDVIVCIGDFFDMPSLSSYDQGTRSMEGRRVLADIEIGNEAMDMLLAPMKDYNKRMKETKHKKYKPEMHFLFGNHEARITRHIESNPQLDGILGLHLLNLSDWLVHPFLEVIDVEGVKFSHYFINPLSGKAIGGSIQNMLNKLQCSFVCGHQQEIKYGNVRSLGGMHHGLVAGAFYQHEERYLGPQGNDHWRGMCMLNNAHSGQFDLQTISIESLLKDYT